MMMWERIGDLSSLINLRESLWKRLVVCLCLRESVYANQFDRKLKSCKRFPSVSLVREN